MEIRNSFDSVALTGPEEGQEGLGVLSGYAARYHQEGNAETEFRRTIQGIEVVEIVVPGAFDQSLKEDDQRSFWNHASGDILGRRSAGTLRLSNDDQGVFYELDVPDTTAGRDAATSIRRGDVDGSSFGFLDRSGKPTLVKRNGTIYREIRDAILIEVSPTPIPAYSGSSVTARSAEATVEGELNRFVEEQNRIARAKMRARVFMLDLPG